MFLSLLSRERPPLAMYQHDLKRLYRKEALFWHIDIFHSTEEGQNLKKGSMEKRCHLIAVVLAGPKEALYERGRILPFCHFSQLPNLMLRAHFLVPMY